MKNILKFTSVLALAVFSAACASNPAARSLKESVEPVTVEGSVPYNGADLSSAVNAAINEAQKNAVSVVADLFIDPTAKAEKYDLFRQNLLKTPQIYVKKHKMLSQGAEGGVYRVRIIAYVFVDKVNAALKGLAFSTQPGRERKAALMVSEYFNAQPSAAGDFTKAFTGYFRGRDTVVFAAPGAVKDTVDEDAFFNAAGESFAGLVFIGKAEAFPLSAAQNAQTGFYPARAEARMKIFETDGRKLLLEVSSRANALDASEEAAFKKALATAGELLAQEITGRIDKILKPQTAVTLRVRGLSGIEAAQKLKEAVERLDINGASFENYSDGEAVMTITLKKPDSQEFASAILRTGVFVMDLESVSQSEIVFSLRE